MQKRATLGQLREILEASTFSGSPINLAMENKGPLLNRCIGKIVVTRPKLGQGMAQHP